jgi:hypothetical protein
MHSTKKLFA